MTEQKVQWSASQKNAFAFVRRGVEDGLSGIGALKQYRAGGGKIGNEYWFALYKTAFNISGNRETIKQIPMTYNVRDTMFAHTEFDFREQYVMQMEVTGYSEELGQRVTKWVTVESPQVITKQEWVWGAQDAVDAGLGSPVFVIDRIKQWDAMKRDKWEFE